MRKYFVFTTRIAEAKLAVYFNVCVSRLCVSRLCVSRLLPAVSEGGPLTSVLC